MSKYEEDYIRYIYSRIEQGEHLVKITDIANVFGYTKQSVIEMIKKMESRGYVKYIPYKGVDITEEGRKIGSRMVRVHRLWEIFLVNELGMKWDEIDDEAHLLEHATSPLLESKLYTYLGKPEYCPHGNPIPDEDGEATYITYMTLDQVTANTTFIVKMVKDEPSLLKYLKQNGVNIGTTLYIQSILAYDGMIHGIIDGQDFYMSKESAKLVSGIIVKREKG
ncbi:metal-dependent transcriptional regulator [Vallitalea pronyensis]|uniref:Manganese transport regulator n=1 Tax=Vallitalea pronyensis TaxID=1348613 RepID=A0A8J8MIY0_9FIRM|nr:metal-dependent transcriptional regulator [Vallitalea pronyensis]QUI22429.1 metal-dependent transcriptional regulator [Vallitalea pronyensis]